SFFVQPSPTAPALSSLTPSCVAVSSPPPTVVVTGSGFTKCSVIRVGGADRPTTYLSTTQLSTTLTAADVGMTCFESFTVFNTGTSYPVSNTLTLTVSPPIIQSIANQGTNLAMCPGGDAGRIHMDIVLSTGSPCVDPSDPATRVYGVREPGCCVSRIW